MPMTVSSLIRLKCTALCQGASRKGWALGSARVSSTSCEACQKNIYGLMVVPNTATTVVTQAAFEARCLRPSLVN